MIIIRKISVGADLKNAMHYIAGQDVLGGTHHISTIREIVSTGAIEVWITSNDKQVERLWKRFNNKFPIAIECNINF